MILFILVALLLLLLFLVLFVLFLLLFLLFLLLLFFQLFEQFQIVAGIFVLFDLQRLFVSFDPRIYVSQHRFAIADIVPFAKLKGGIGDLAVERFGFGILLHFVVTVGQIVAYRITLFLHVRILFCGQGVVAFVIRFFRRFEMPEIEHRGLQKQRKEDHHEPLHAYSFRGRELSEIKKSSTARASG